MESNSAKLNQQGKTMKLSRLLIFSLLVIFSLLSRPSFAEKNSYVVYLGGHSHGPEISQLDIHRVTESHYQLLGSYLGGSERAKSAMFYSYTNNINGFAATLEEEEAEAISKHPKVISVFLNKGRKLHTTRSWQFLGLEKDGNVPSRSLWKKARFGKDTIIGNLDTGVWPESPSFSDEEIGPIPSRWKGICQNDTKAGVPCNRKLIGARYFNKGYIAYVNKYHKFNTKFNTARDQEGHGSHTLSTAGGNFVHGASVFGYGNGTAKGGSPHARVAAYKVCWPRINGRECFDADIMAGFDAAIHDGVDVLSVSVGGDATDYFNDGISIGAFHAVKKGITVVCSAGNSGPADGTVSNVAPWILTVGASTIDREFPTYAALGNDKKFKGQSLSVKSLAYKMYPLINATHAKAAKASAKNATLCKPGSLDPKKVKGKILVCLRGENARVDKGLQASIAGAAGMILANDILTGNEIIADAHFLPAAHITYTDGLEVFAYINSTKSPMAFITPVKTNMGTKPSPFMASFSSKGPNTVTPEILKPDITAPGVSIIAAYSQATSPTGEDMDKRRVLFNSQSGTSMSCPHISGVVGLLKTLHPDWSPAAIKSAIMTSARTRDNNVESMLNASFSKANAFSYGAGHVRPNSAMDPGLVYDTTTNDYLNFLCNLGYNETQIELFSDTPYKCLKSSSLLDLNYPSITIPNLSHSATVTRTVKNVGSPKSTYFATVHQPKGISVSVNPKKLNFKKIGEEKTFKVYVKASHSNAARDYAFGKLIWSDGKHYVRSPIVVKAT